MDLTCFKPERRLPNHSRTCLQGRPSRAPAPSPQAQGSRLTALAQPASGVIIATLCRVIKIKQPPHGCVLGNLLLGRCCGAPARGEAVADTAQRPLLLSSGRGKGGEHRHLPGSLRAGVGEEPGARATPPKGPAGGDTGLVQGSAVAVAQ